MDMPDINIGLLEDELPQAQLVCGWLNDAGYQVQHGATGADFLQAVQATPADILILDWQLPDCEGIDVLAQLRGELQFTGPILFATAKDSEDDIVRGLAAGADDYLIKPLRQAELLARLNALWRRAGNDPGNAVSLGPIRLDLDNQEATIDAQPVALTPTEFRLATCLLTHRDQLLSREFLLREVWGVDAELDTRTVDVHMSRVRKTLRIGPDMGYCIKTVYRHGYRLEAL